MFTLPFTAISIYGITLCVSYLVNNWLDLGTIPILVFSSIFLLGYPAIRAAVYVII